MAIWYFIVEGDQVKRFPATHLQQIHKGKKTVPDKAGETLKMIEITVELENKKPSRVGPPLGFLMKLDKNGKYDSWENIVNLAKIIDGQLFGEAKYDGTNIYSFDTRKAKMEFEKTRWKLTHKVLENFWEYFDPLWHHNE